MEQIIAAVIGAILAFILGIVAYIFRDKIKDWIMTIGLPWRHYDSVEEILGVNSDVKRFIAREKESNGRDYFSIGSCIEIARSPTLRTGWLTSKMLFFVEHGQLQLIPCFEELYNEWKHENPRNPDKVRYSLRNISGQNTTDNPEIIISLKKTNFGRVFAIQNKIDSLIQIEPGTSKIPRNHFERELLNLPQTPIPNFLVFHIVVKTCDNYVVFIQRSGESHYYPGHWSVSFEEQLCEEDIAKPNPFIAAIRRGLFEELGINESEEQIQVKLLSIFMEYENLLTSCCAVAIVPYNSEEIRRRWVEVAPDKNEAKRISFFRSEISPLAKILVNNAIDCEDLFVEEEFWHPTTKYRLFLYGASEFGIQNFIHFLENERRINIKNTKKRRTN